LKAILTGRLDVETCRFSAPAVTVVMAETSATVVLVEAGAGALMPIR
jgi:hypothetical protein